MLGVKAPLWRMWPASWAGFRPADDIVVITTIIIIVVTNINSTVYESMLADCLMMPMTAMPKPSGECPV